MEGSLAAISPAAQQLILNINSTIVNPLVVVIFTFALAAFLWGVRGYVSNADNPEARATGANQILWGIIGMALMLMSFTIVRIVVHTFGLDKGEGGTKTKSEMDNVLGN